MAQGAVNCSSEEPLDKLVSLYLLHVGLFDVHGSSSSSQRRGILWERFFPLWSQYCQVLPWRSGRKGGREEQEGGREGGKDHSLYLKTVTNTPYTLDNENTINQESMQKNTLISTESNQAYREVSFVSMVHSKTKATVHTYVHTHKNS